MMPEDKIVVEIVVADKIDAEVMAANKIDFG
jgi:hypothetical protein